MNRKLMELAERYVARRKQRMRLLQTVTALALVVAICTSYVLMMPGLTMAAETYCGLEEHTHTADCYVDELVCLIPEREAETVFTQIMRCNFEPHHHSSGCYNALGELSCGYWDQYIHEHDEMCYDANGVLICTLEEHPMHKHTDACYEWEKQLTCTLAESEGHVHTDECYRAQEPTCGLFENDGHQHTAECITETRTLICTQDTATPSDMPHVHDDSCYEVTRTYTCGLTEGEGAHHHTAECYPTTEEPTCGRIEGEGAHTHTDECYEMVRGNLKCNRYPDPAKVHTHSASCVDPKTGYYTCGYVQVLTHQHTSACIVTVAAEDSGHHHTADCYERHYICGLEEHTHTADCYYDPTPNPDATVEPTVEPTTEPTVEPTVEPTAEPTEEPTTEPTAEPTTEPTEEPTAEPTAEPTTEPTAEPTTEPTEEPTTESTEEPTTESTVEPTAEPTVEPTTEPTAEPTAEPTTEPTPAPTEEPTTEPTAEPSATPSLTVIPSLDDIAVQPAPNLDAAFAVQAEEDSMDGLSVTDIEISNQHVDDENKFLFDFSAKIKIKESKILGHGSANPIQIPADKFHGIPADQLMNGTDSSFSNSQPAFKFKYNSQTEQVELWFTDEYIAWTRKKMQESGEDVDATGSMMLGAEIRAEDVKDSEDGKLTISLGDRNKTIEREEFKSNDKSLLTDLSTSKSGGTIDWAKNTISYSVNISSTKGTNGENITLQDEMTAKGSKITLTGLTVKSVTKNYYGEITPSQSNSTTITTDGTCECGQTGMHIHYVNNITEDSGAHTAKTDYVLPPLGANESYQITYEYTFDRANWTGEFDKLTNTAKAKTGSEGNWDYSDSTGETEIDVKVDKLQKSGSNSQDGYVTWTMTVNSNHFNIKDKELSDTMFSQVMDEAGNLRFAPADGSGYMSSIKMKTAEGDVTITADNMGDYFTVDESGKLTFKDTDAKFTFVYKTPVAASSESQTVENDAKFDDEEEHISVTVPPDDRFTVAKKVADDMPSDPTKNGTNENHQYPLDWQVDYTFAATKDVKYRLNFGDELQKQSVWTNDGEQMLHFMTKAQAEALLNQLQALDIVQKHVAQGVPYTITLKAWDARNNAATLTAIHFDGVNLMREILPDDFRYYGFSFATDGNGVVLNDTDEAEDAKAAATLNYQTTIVLDDLRKTTVDFGNKAFNAGRNADAWYKAYPNDLVEKKFGTSDGDLTGDKKITLHENKLMWTIVLRTDGDAHDEITLLEKLPAHIEVESIEFGGSKLVKDEHDATRLTVEKKKNDGQTPEAGYEVSSNWGEQKIAIKATLSTDNGQQQIAISMKPLAENYGSDTILEGKSDLTFKVHCKIDEALMGDMDNELWQDEKLVLGELKNSASVSYKDGDEVNVITKDQTTDLTYEEEHAEPVTVQKGYTVTPGRYNATIHYSIDINQAAKQLNPQSSTIELKDQMTCIRVGLANGYPYLREINLLTDSFKLYYAKLDENGKPILTLDESGDGHLVRGAEVPKNLWKMSSTEEDDQYWFADYSYGETVKGKVPGRHYVNTTITVPDGVALILEYAVNEAISLPPEVTNEYTLGNVASAGITPELSNEAQLTATSEKSQTQVDKNSQYFAYGEGFIHNSLIITKVDSANNTLLLPGTGFTLYAWSNTEQKFVSTGNVITADGNGQIVFNYDQQKLNERPLDPNVAYLLVETNPIEPYYYTLEDRPIVAFHVPARAEDDAENPQTYPDGYTKETYGSITKDALNALVHTTSGIEGQIDGVYTVNGSDRIYIQVANTKDRHDMNVVKTWSGDDASTRPASVQVMLRRYALTQEQYDHMLAMAETSTANKTVKLTVKRRMRTSIDNPVVVSNSATFPVGATVEIVLNVTGQEWNNDRRLTFDGKTWQQDSDGKFRKTITVEKNGTLDFESKYQTREFVWKTDTPDAGSVWTITFNQKAQSLFTSAQWDYIQQFPDTDYEGRSGVLTAANNWQTGWTDLESTGATADGHKLYYIYYIVEGKVPYYTTSGINYSTAPGASLTTGTVTAELINTHKPENKEGEINFEVEKQWLMPNGERHTVTEDFPEVQVALYKTRWDWENNAWVKKNTERIYTARLSEVNNWKFKASGLETYTVEIKNGVVQGAYAYTYSVVELNQTSGFEHLLTIDGVPQNPAEYFNNGQLSNPKTEYQIGTTAKGTIAVKNVEIEPMSIRLFKNFEYIDFIDIKDEDELTFTLTREIQDASGNWVADTSFPAQTKTWTKAQMRNNEYHCLFTDLPKYYQVGVDSNGNSIRRYYRYRVEETAYNGAEPPFEVRYMVNAQTDTEAIIDTVYMGNRIQTDVLVTNYGLETFNVKLTKEWVRQRDTNEITFWLLSERATGVDDDGNYIWSGEYEYTDVKQTYSEENPNPVWEFKDLPKYEIAEDGTLLPYRYFIKEGYRFWADGGWIFSSNYIASFSGYVTADGKVIQPSAGETAEIVVTNMQRNEIGYLNYFVSKKWDETIQTMPDSVEINAKRSYWLWMEDHWEKGNWINGEWQQGAYETTSLITLKEENGDWSGGSYIQFYTAYYQADGSLVLKDNDQTGELAPFMTVLEPFEAIGDNFTPIFTNIVGFPTQPSDVFELAEDGTPLRVKAPENTTVELKKGSIRTDWKGASVELINIPANSLTIEKWWDSENGKPLDSNIKEVPITITRLVWCPIAGTTGENPEDYAWTFDSDFAMNVSVKAEDGWKLTVNGLADCDTVLNPDGSRRAYRYSIVENTSGTSVDHYIPSYDGDVVREGDNYYIVFKNHAGNVEILNTPQEIRITKIWPNSGDYGSRGENHTIYLTLSERYTNSKGETVEENLLDLEDWNRFDWSDVTITPSDLWLNITKINGESCLSISGNVPKGPTSCWEIKIDVHPMSEDSEFVIREIETAGYVNNLKNGELVMKPSGVAKWIVNSETELSVSKFFRTPDNQPYEVSENTDVYLKVWRAKLDKATNTLFDVEHYIPDEDRFSNTYGVHVNLTDNGLIKIHTIQELPQVTVTMRKLPRYWINTGTDTYERGEWYYYVREVDANGNEVPAIYASGEGADAAVRPADSNNAPCISIINTLSGLSVRKVWTSLDNQITLNPAALPDITLTLMQTISDKPLSDENSHLTDKEIGQVTLGWDAEQGKVVAKNVTGWSHGEVTPFTAAEGSKNLQWGYRWADLPTWYEAPTKDNQNGIPYRYYVVEQTPVGSGWQLVTDSPATTGSAIPANAGERVFQITNTPITYVLPETGGIGTVPFTLGGLLLMAAASFLLGQEIKRRRREE